MLQFKGTARCPLFLSLKYVSNMDNRKYDFPEISKRISPDGQGKVTGVFRDYSIATAFQPIYSLTHRSPVGYEALCRVRGADGSTIPPLELFRQVHGEAENVLLDRLCRAIHVHNFSAFPDKISWIFLNVNPLTTVVGKNYGPFFRDMLQHYQLPPDRVVVEILEQDIHDEAILSAAVDYYKELGCLVALDDFGAAHSNFDRLWRIQPDIVKFDRSIILQAEASGIVRKALPSLVGLVREIGCLTLMEGVETEPQALIAIDAGVDMVQGYYFGYPGESLVYPSENESRLTSACRKYAEAAANDRARYRQIVDGCVGGFSLALKEIKLGVAEPEQSCSALLSLPGVRCIYFIDDRGYQIGKTISPFPGKAFEDPRYRPLTEASEANWSRREYFRQAMLNPKKIQISRPYRSLADRHQCITLSALVESHRGRLVACVDIDWTGNDILVPWP